VVHVDDVPQEAWRVRTVGPASRGQRRAAVRAPLPFRTTLTYGDVVGEGTTVDISEGGIRAWFDLSVLAEHTTPTHAPDTGSPTGEDALPRVPEIGSMLTVTVWLDDRQHVTCKAEVTRHHQRNDRRTELSLRFIALPEKMEDLIRREVFAGLRDLRARGLI
jgi:c-di-GMP-binding flagellar brake protein YcgR